MVFESNDKKDSKNWLSIPIIFVISLIFTFFGKLGWFTNISNTIGYICDPIYITSSNAANTIKDFFGTLTEISEFRAEFNEMKLKIAEYEIQNIEYQQLRKENGDLKEQLDLANKGNTYVEASVLDHIETDSMIINKGLDDGIVKGDIVVIGNSFIGIIIDAGQYTSKVRLPISKSSFLEVYIESAGDSSQNILSKAVASGSSDGIKIENISMNSDVQNGDTVIVNDSKVGEHLILGKVVGLSEDPATTTRSGYVSPIVDYYDLVNVFVRIENVD
ncbi:MAG: rod shape-determining protein MreC [Candidatus Dojkabacteria bacterium]|nr:rod shape-determining protein MreC [Candidatus Dojkabacteria bacterium]